MARDGYDVTQATTTTELAATDHALVIKDAALYKATIQKILDLATAAVNLAEKVATKTGAYTITSSDNIINADTDTAAAVIALNMDNATQFWDSTNSKTRIVTVNNIGATHNTTVTPFGSQTIQGASSLTIAAGASAQIYTDGSNLFTRAK